MKKILIIILIGGIFGGVIGYNMYNKPHENMNAAKADISITATEIFSDFESDETAADQKYNDKTISVTGTVADVATEDDGTVKVTLESGGDFGGVICQLEESENISNYKTGSEVTLKGKCTGYLMDVILVRCVKAN